MIITADLSSLAAIEEQFEGVQAGVPPVPGKLELTPEGIKVTGSYTGNPEGTTPNEKYLGWWYALEPTRFPFFQGWERGSARYRFRIGPEVPAASAFNGGKWPGWISPYDLWSETVQPPSPAPSAFGTWEARVWYGDFDPVSNTYGTGIYYYGVRGPRPFIGADGEPTMMWFPGAVHVDTPGTPTSIGKYFGSGTQGGVPRANVRIKVGQWYTFEEQFVLNSVKDEALDISTTYPNAQEALDKCLANANEDGILRLLVDDELAYEATRVAFRGLKKVRTQSFFANIYDGGRSQYPKSAASFEFGSLTLSDEVQGGGVEPMPDLPTQEQKDAATANAHDAVDALSALVTVGEPVPPPPDPTIDAFTAVPETLPMGGGDVTLEWMTSNADLVTLDGEEVEADGDETQTVTGTTTFTLAVEGGPTAAVTVEVEVAPEDGDLPEPSPLPPPPYPDSALGNLVATMQPDSWAELKSQLIGPVINSNSQSGCVIPYSNAAAWDAHHAEIAVVAADHLVQPRLCIYSLETNRWRARRWSPEPQFVHAYQHTACIGGVRYYRFAGELLADDGSRDWVACAPPNVSIGQVATVSLSVWPAPYPGAVGDVLMLYDGNGGQIAVYDPFADNWLDVLTGMNPGLAGLYHVVSAYSPQHRCLVYGGGGGGNAPLNPAGNAPDNRVLWRLNADQTKTRMPDAPFGIGVFSQANFVGGSDGNFYALGFGQHWRLHPVGGGSWTRLHDPPADFIQPNSGQGFIACTVPGAVCYIDAGYGIPARMRIYKPA